MVSLNHEALLALFRNLPTLAPELLREALHVPLPAFTEARIESAELTDIKPAQYHADLVILLSDGKPVYAIIVEVQLGADPKKRFSWPVYIVNLRARIECPVCLLVVAPDAVVASWCAEPIETGHPGLVLKPLVLGPSAVPIVTDRDKARAMPELGVLSVMAHGHTEHAIEVAQAALPAVVGLDEERAKFYADLIDCSISEAARKALEAWMNRGGYEYQGPFAKKHIAEGQRLGKLEGRAQAVLDVLQAREIEVPESVRQRVLSSTDAGEIDRWLRRAVVVSTAAEIFDEPAS